MRWTTFVALQATGPSNPRGAACGRGGQCGADTETPEPGSALQAMRKAFQDIEHRVVLADQHAVTIGVLLVQLPD